MARPQALQFLRKGSLLIGKIFPRFVETWNWLIGAFDSMVGDEEIDPKNGLARIDRTNPDRPIVRINAQKIAKMAGGGEAGGEVSVTGTDGVTVKGSAFEFEPEEDSNVTVRCAKDESTGVVTVKIGVYYK